MDVGVSDQEADMALRRKHLAFFTNIDALIDMDAGVSGEGVDIDIRGEYPENITMFDSFTDVSVQTKGRLRPQGRNKLHFILCLMHLWMWAYNIKG